MVRVLLADQASDAHHLAFEINVEGVAADIQVIIDFAALVRRAALLAWDDLELSGTSRLLARQLLPG